VRYQRNQIECAAFSRSTFIQAVQQASHSSETAPNEQTKYLAGYLERDLSAKTLLVERHYIDRHFIEEFSAYYGRCLAPVPNACTRLHAFSLAFDTQALDERIRQAASGGFEQVLEELQEAYLGFIVVRPLPSVPLGRTVLRCPAGLETRKYETTVDYSVHLLGFELSVRGIAFQQQDVAVAACATTAIWTALQRMARHEGGRTPTPSAITQAAVKHVGHPGRPLPGRDGLTTIQICEALRAFEFGPEVIQAGATVQGCEKFRKLLGIYLRSGIPVILSVVDRSRGEPRGHAVTVVGYREGGTPLESNERLGVIDGRGRRDLEVVPVSLTNTAFDRLFIHDDRLGPYASASLEAVAGEEGLYLRIKHPDDSPPDQFQVRHATVPLYPKLRSNAKDLLGSAFDLTPVIPRGSSVSLELYFTRSGSYMASLYEMRLDTNRLIHIQRSASLSRYVGIARWYVDGEPVLDSVWDTTDIRRRKRGECEALLATVALHPKYEGFVDRCAEDYGVLAG
jgi:hypothetical protein